MYYKFEELTGKVDSEARLADVEIGLELNGNDVEGAVDPVGQQGTTYFSQKHLVIRTAIPYLQDVMRCFCVKG